MSRFSLIVLIGLLAGCSSPQPAADQEPVETTAASETTDEPQPEPASAPQSAPGANVGDMPEANTAAGVAARIAKAHGAAALADAGEIEFDFIVVNANQEVFKASHRWDVQNDRAHVAWNDKTSDIIAVVDLNDSSKGWATVGGVPATEAEVGKHLEAAYARWVNDAYWLAMPLKLTDAGVNLELLEDREHNERPHKVLKVTFGEVGLTPGDTYWVYADPKTYVVSRWDMLLQGAKEGAEPTTVSWESPVTKAGVTLHSDHRIKDTPRNIRTPLLSVNESVDEAVFAAPAE